MNEDDQGTDHHQVQTMIDNEVQIVNDGRRRDGNAMNFTGPRPTRAPTLREPEI